MTKFSNGTVRLAKLAARQWMFDIEPYSRPSVRTYEEITDEERLRRVLKRAVSRDHAPQKLIDAIKAGIRG